MDIKSYLFFAFLVAGVILMGISNINVLVSGGLR